MTDENVKIGRLAMRQEGDNWVAYYALPDSMKDPVFIGSILMSAVIKKPERKQAFMQMMRDVVSEIIEETTGVRPVWGGVKDAPEHERAGHS